MKILVVKEAMEHFRTEFKVQVYGCVYFEKLASVNGKIAYLREKEINVRRVLLNAIIYFHKKQNSDAHEQATRALELYL